MSVRPSVRSYYWKINCDVERSMVLLIDQLYWRQSTRTDGNYWTRKITARRWLHKYVGAECGASSFTCFTICPSVCLSHLFHNVHVIVSSWNFQELLPLATVMCMQKFKLRGQRSSSQRSKPNLAVSRLKPQFEFTYDDEMMHKAWCCLGEKPYSFPRSCVKFQGHTGQKIADFDPNWAFPDCNSSLNWLMAIKWYTKLEVQQRWCPNVFQGHLSNFRVTQDKKSTDFYPNGPFPDCNSVWDHGWLWSSYKAWSFKASSYKAWSSREKVPSCFSRSSVNFEGWTGQKKVFIHIGRFLTVTPVLIHQWLMHNAEHSIKQVPYCFARSSIKFDGHTCRKINDFESNLS